MLYEKKSKQKCPVFQLSKQITFLKLILKYVYGTVKAGKHFDLWKSVVRVTQLFQTCIIVFKKEKADLSLANSDD